MRELDKKKITSIILIIIITLGAGLSLLFFIKSKYANLSVVKIEGATNYELGVDYGQKCKGLIQGLCALLREVEDATGLFGVTFTDLQARFEPYIPSYLIDEMQGVAIGAGVRYLDVLMINCFAEVMMQASAGAIACTQFAKVNKVAATTGPILGRTLDFFPSFLLQDFEVFLVANIGGKRWIGHTIAGMVGFLSGMNDDGLVVSVSLVDTDEMGSGKPMVLAIREALQMNDTVIDAAYFFGNHTYGLGWNYMLLDATGNAAVVEVTRLHNYTRWISAEPNTDYISATNKFHSTVMQNYGPHPSHNSEIRKVRAEELMAADNEFQLINAIQITRDVYDPDLMATNPGRNSICRKWIRQTFLPGGTLGSFVALPQQGYVVVSNGYPDSALWYGINFEGEVTGPLA